MDKDKLIEIRSRIEKAEHEFIFPNGEVDDIAIHALELYAEIDLLKEQLEAEMADCKGLKDTVDGIAKNNCPPHSTCLFGDCARHWRQWVENGGPAQEYERRIRGE